MLNVGDIAPDFTAEDQDGATHRLKKYRGQTVVLYFYPKDLTSGCTTQACDFRDNLNRLAAHNVVLLGVSPDSVKSHRKFADKESLNFPLLADPEKELVNRYGVWVEKSMYGRKYMGVQRTTFILDKRGRIKHIFPKVKVNGHVQEVLDALAD